MSYTVHGATGSITSAGTSSSDAAIITRNTDWTVLAVTSTSNSSGIKLPNNSQVGDLVELHNVGGGSLWYLYPATGETIDQSSSGQQDSGKSSWLLRKMTSTAWVSVSQLSASI